MVEARRGGLYSILGGNISGEFVEAERPSKIVQRWRERSWPDGEQTLRCFFWGGGGGGVVWVLVRSRSAMDTFPPIQCQGVTYIIVHVLARFQEEGNVHVVCIAPATTQIFSAVVCPDK